MNCSTQGLFDYSDYLIPCKRNYNNIDINDLISPYFHNNLLHFNTFYLNLVLFFLHAYGVAQLTNTHTN